MKQKAPHFQPRTSLDGWGRARDAPTQGPSPTRDSVTVSVIGVRLSIWASARQQLGPGGPPAQGPVQSGLPDPTQMGPRPQIPGRVPKARAEHPLCAKKAHVPAEGAAGAGSETGPRAVLREATTLPGDTASTRPANVTSTNAPAGRHCHTHF